MSMKWRLGFLALLICFGTAVSLRAMPDHSLTIVYFSDPELQNYVGFYARDCYYDFYGTLGQTEYVEITRTDCEYQIPIFAGRTFEANPVPECRRDDGLLVDISCCTTPNPTLPCPIY